MNRRQWTMLEVSVEAALLNAEAPAGALRRGRELAEHGYRDLGGEG